MNYQDTKNWISVQGNTDLKTKAEYDDVQMARGMKFRMGTCSGMAGFSSSAREWEIVGFADPIVWMALCQDPNPENWSERIRNAPAVIVKDQWNYEIYDAREIAGWLK